MGFELDEDYYKMANERLAVKADGFVRLFDCVIKRGCLNGRKTEHITPLFQQA